MSEQNKVLEACVEMRLLLQADDALKVRVVDVRVNTEEAFKDGADDLLEVRGKGNTCTTHNEES